MYIIFTDKRTQDSFFSAIELIIYYHIPKQTEINNKIKQFGRLLPVHRYSQFTVICYVKYFLICLKLTTSIK